MKFIFSLLLLAVGLYSYGQNSSTEEDIVRNRRFNDDLNQKYSGSDFQYIEDQEKPIEQNKKIEKTTSGSKSFSNGFVYFVSHIFPYILGIIVILIILKTFIGIDINFWKSKNKNKKIKEELVYEDEIDESDYEALLKRAIKNNDYRSAIRFYYLTTLKLLSDKKLIELNKDKTNADYLFELNNENLRKQFSQLSYIFSYVWYGEFSIDQSTFKQVENKYQSFKTLLK